MKIEQVSFTEILDAPNASELMAEYEQECANPLLGPINPQREIYAKMEANGAMFCFAAFDGGKVVGFGTFLATIYPHYGVKVATGESIFVQSSHRGSSIGAYLLKTIEDYARQLGCVGIYDSAPVGSQFEALLDAKKSYKRTNAVFYRSL